MAFWQTLTKQSDEVDQFTIDLNSWLNDGESLTSVSVEKVIEFKSSEAETFGPWSDDDRPDELRVIPVTDGVEGSETDIPVADIYDEALVTLIDTDTGVDASNDIPVTASPPSSGIFSVTIGKGGDSGKDYVISLRWVSDIGREEVTHIKLSIRNQLAP